MKRIDRFLITNFLPPFVVSFVIALFVLVMQTLWLYIDDIAGKGVSLLNLLEMIFYLSIGLMPKALPIGILIAAVMVFGGLAERYELSSLKSAGISLTRVMRPALLFSVFVAIFSLFCSEYLIPVANLKFISRLHDIRKKKSTLTIEEGVFNRDFGNLVLYVGDKADNNRDIGDIRIYDHGNGSSPGQLKLITAKNGQMYPSEDGSFFIMKLFNGHQYEDLKPTKTSAYPFTSSSFEEWTKVFDLSAFDLSESENDLFKSHQATMTSSQLILNIDSLKYELGVQRNKLVYDYNKIAGLSIDSNFLDKNLIGNKEKYGNKVKRSSKDTSISNRQLITFIKNAPITDDDLIQDTMFDERYTSVLALFSSKQQRTDILKKALSIAENYQRRIKTSLITMDHLRDRRVKQVFELHSKLAFALVCIIFIFIGAPMGAIVRKGGFGYPLLISIIFFVIYILMNTSLRKVCEGGDFNPVLGAWIPNLFTLTCGTVLTFLALNDSSIRLSNPLTWVLKIWNSFGNT